MMRPHRSVKTVESNLPNPDKAKPDSQTTRRRTPKRSAPFPFPEAKIRGRNAREREKTAGKKAEERKERRKRWKRERSVPGWLQRSDKLLRGSAAFTQETIRKAGTSSLAG